VGFRVESSSFKYGFVHETVVEMDILLGDGNVVTCTPNNEYKDLFYGFPNSYGTLGYVLKLKAQIIPVKKYVKLTYLKYEDKEEMLASLKQFSISQKSPTGSEIDFLDGVAFAPNEYYISIGELTDHVPYSSNYSWMNIYYKSLQKRRADFLPIYGYIWRWDYDWFWCSRYFYMQIAIMRLFLGSFLGSKYYMAVWRWYVQLGFHNENMEFVIQDVEIPVDRCSEFIDFFYDKINIRPFWMCPVKAFHQNVDYPLYKYEKDRLYINFGFWDTVDKKDGGGFNNKMVRKKVVFFSLF